MQSFVVVSVALSLLYSVNAQGNQQLNPNVQPIVNAVVQPSGAVVVIPTGKAGDPGVACQAYWKSWAPDAKCTARTCRGVHTIDCRNMTSSEVSRDLDTFSRQKLFAETNFRPLHLIVEDSSLNFSQNMINSTPSGSVSVLNWIQKLELINTDVGANLDSNVFNGLINMSSLSLTGVPIGTIGKGAFSGLPALRDVDMANLRKLRKIESGFADPLFTNGACLTMYHKADGLPCDCSTVKYVQNYRKSSLGGSQLAGGNRPATLAGSPKYTNYTNYTCDINIWCQSGSQKVNMIDINTADECKVLYVVATTKDPKGAGSTISYHGNYPVLLVSLFVLLSAIITV